MTPKGYFQLLWRYSAAVTYGGICFSISIYDGSLRHIASLTKVTSIYLKWFKKFQIKKI
jgi:hypothetical protein